MVILTIPGIPPSPNVLKRKYRNPHAYRKLRMAWENDLAHSVSGSWRKLELQRQARTGRMFVEVTLHHSREYDADNLVGSLKPVVDALANVGYIGGDSYDKLALLPPRQEKCAQKDCKTVIKIGLMDYGDKDARSPQI